MQTANNNSEQHDGFPDRDNSEKTNLLTNKRKSEESNEEKSSYSIDIRNRESSEMSGAVGTSLEAENEPSSDRAHKRRKMNAVHSKRKRDRQKIEIEVLRGQCSGLSAQNLELYHKNKKLDELLQTAQEFDKHCSPQSSIEQSDLNCTKFQSLTHPTSADTSLNVFNFGQYNVMPQVQVLSSESINSNSTSTVSANEMQIGSSGQPNENVPLFNNQLNVFLSALSHLSKNNGNIDNTMLQVANHTNQPVLQLYGMLAEQISSANHNSRQNHDMGMIQESTECNTDEHKCSAIDVASNNLRLQGSTVDSTSFPLLFSTASGPIDLQFPPQQAFECRNDQNPRNQEGISVDNLQQQTLISSLLRAISQRGTGIDLQTLSSVHNFFQTTASLSSASQLRGDTNQTSTDSNSIRQHLGSLLQLIANFVDHSIRANAESNNS